jgi:ADP-ribose pyrophosphatase YjhB (NUDIX family)
MPISPYIRALREKIGHDRLLNPGVAALIRDAEGRILLQRRSDDGSWSLPAGAVDPGERPGEALIREVFEETGLKVVPEQLAGVFSGPGFLHVYPHGDRLEVFSVVFLCRVVGGVLEPRDGESAEFRYVAAAELPDSGLLRRYPRELYSFQKGDTALFAWDESWLDALEALL